MNMKKIYKKNAIVELDGVDNCIAEPQISVTSSPTSKFNKACCS